MSVMGRDFLVLSYWENFTGQITSAVDLNNIIKDESKEKRFRNEAKTKDIKEDVKDAVLDAPKWLPFAGEQYNISSDIKDYVMVPVVIMPSDLPNRNGVAFPFKELTRFNTDSGSIAYSTFKGKPTFENHQNSDHTKAKGVILSTAFRRMKNVRGKELWKLIALCGFDRKRDPVVANSILTNKKSSFSMGAYCRDYECSICGSSATKEKCEHVDVNKPNEFKIYDGHLAYLKAIDPIGFETSFLSNQPPAFDTAVSTPENKLMLES